jgi:hypothetical protein
VINKVIDEDNNEEDVANLEVAHVDVQCHLLIKDSDTGEVLVNKRG